MPVGVDRKRRRVAWLAVALLPLGGCASSPIHIHIPGVTHSHSHSENEQGHVVDLARSNPFRLATLRLASKEDSEALKSVTQELLALNDGRGRPPASSMSNADAMSSPGSISSPDAMSSPGSMSSPDGVFARLDDQSTSSIREIPSLPPVDDGLHLDAPTPEPLTAYETMPSTIGTQDPSTMAMIESFDSAIASSADGFPQMIDLSSSLGLAGGNAWVIQLARQRTVEAHADLQQAKALWLPTLQLGVGWNHHSGRIQATDGSNLEVSRSSLFAGGGATLGTAPVAGGSGGPFRLFADLALADAYFQPKIAERQLSARRAGVGVAKNDALLDAGITYIDLLEATGQIADTQTAIDAMRELRDLTVTFAEAGAGAQADVDRAETALSRLTQQLRDANRKSRSTSARLARRLRLDPTAPLQPADTVLVPVELSADASDVGSLIATASRYRPEISELSHEIAAICLAVRKSEVEPWVPHVAVATSGGSFGGGNGASIDSRAGRSDIDLQAVWQLESLGLGVAAKRNRADSQLAQKRTELADLRDDISAEVVSAYEDVIGYREQIEIANATVAKAEDSFQKNLQRVRADEGLPIELLQAIHAKMLGLQDRTEAVSNYNRAQLRLLYQTGQLCR